MKKLLGILVLGLLLTGNAYAKKLSKCSFWKGVKSYNNCIGEHEYDDGYYIGSFKNGKPHGQGQYQGNEGSVYVGEFLNGELNGSGTLEFNGDKYIGEFKDGKRHGKGAFTFGKGNK